MLDDLSIHVDDIQGAVRRIGELDRPKPDIGARNKLGPLLVRGSLRNPSHAVSAKPLAVKQVAPAIRDECVPHILAGPGVTPIDHKAGRTGKVPARSATALDRSRHQSGHPPLRAQHPPRFLRTRPEHWRCRSIGGDAYQGPRHRKPRIPTGIPCLGHEHPDVIAVVAGKPTATVVERLSILTAAGLRRELQRSRIKREIAAAQVHWRCLGRQRKTDLPTVGSRQPIDPVVPSPAETVKHRLHVQLIHPVRGEIDAEPRKNLSPQIGPAVAIRVFQIPDVRCRRHEHPTIPAEKPGRPRQIVGVDRARIQTPVPGGILQHPDLAQMRPRIASLRVIDHLHHIHPTVLVETQLDGIADQRFGHDQLNPKPGSHPETGQSLFRGQRRDPWQRNGLGLSFTSGCHPRHQPACCNNTDYHQPAYRIHDCSPTSLGGGRPCHLSELLAAGSAGSWAAAFAAAAARARSIAACNRASTSAASDGWIF